MSNPLARLAIARPIRPSPGMPSRLPVNLVASGMAVLPQRPARTAILAGPMNDSGLIGVHARLLDQRPPEGDLGVKLVLERFGSRKFRWCGLTGEAGQALDHLRILERLT